MNKKRIYVAGPLNAQAVDYLSNCSNMMTEAEHLRRLGFSVYVPCIDLLMGIKFNYTDYHDYFDNSQPWLAVADAVYLCKGWQASKGTAKEIELAESLDIPVFDDPDMLLKYFEEKATINIAESLDELFEKWDELLTTMSSKQTKES
jgi:hypothetical protein